MKALRPLLTLALLVGLAACDTAGPSASADVVRITPTSKKASASPEKVDVCHQNGNGAYRLIEVSSRALDAHLGHGDGVPGGEAPGGGSFDNACEIVEEEAAFACTIETVNDPANGLVTELRLDILDLDAIRSTNIGVSTFSGTSNIVLFETTRTPEGDGIVSARAQLAVNPDGPYESAIDLLTPFDVEDEELLAIWGPVTVG